MEEVAQRGAPEFVLITGYHYADQVKENEVFRACGTHAKGEESMEGFDGKARRKEITRKTEA
jgi:hypothetical protein